MLRDHQVLKDCFEDIQLDSTVLKLGGHVTVQLYQAVMQLTLEGILKQCRVAIGCLLQVKQEIAEWTMHTAKQEVNHQLNKKYIQSEKLQWC